MAHIAVIGERARVEGWALGGARAVPADDPEEVRAAWEALDDEVAVVVLTPEAARCVEGERERHPGAVLIVVMPP
ncbi:V-type ATP synthase subunit F [Actinomadura bangladeshensis]|uniref:V-type ATP synthase subunit F n=1 Tax=Actinomadura bangladeshensis TaxID=453573 RepID=A0A4R4P2I7_9ACTN|nr:V-type ATP synthase subunit F [Actinomadura bangladeshensis]TDC16165.1 hypothetical protein E1284_13545 [Actinomadura bangladeshensis]